MVCEFYEFEVNPPFSHFIRIQFCVGCKFRVTFWATSTHLDILMEFESLLIWDQEHVCMKKFCLKHFFWKSQKFLIKIFPNCLQTWNFLKFFSFPFFHKLMPPKMVNVYIFWHSKLVKLKNIFKMCISFGMLHLLLHLSFFIFCLCDKKGNHSWTLKLDKSRRYGYVEFGFFDSCDDECVVKGVYHQ